MKTRIVLDQFQASAFDIAIVFRAGRLENSNAGGRLRPVRFLGLWILGWRTACRHRIGS